MSETPERSRFGRGGRRPGGGTLDFVPPRLRRFVLPGTVVVLAVLYPTLLPYLDDIPLVGDLWPSVGTAVIMIVYTMMAIGLNVVVGYAGLLDLGYVAFYAAGAYTAAWFASQHFEEVTLHIGSAGIISTLTGHPPLGLDDPR